MCDGKCRVCGATQNLKQLSAKDYFLGSKKEYLYLLCCSCCSLSIGKIPEDLSGLYKDYYSFSEPSKISNFKLQLYKHILKKTKVFSKALNFLLKKQEDLPILSLQTVGLQPHKKILDVGCGSGSLLCLLHKMGFKNCLGIDPFLENDISYPSGLKLNKQDLFDLDEKFDLIMFHHVFEHFPNPKEVLSHVSKLLSPNGICLIRIPNVDSYSFLRYKENWFSIHAPFHLFLPSRAGMEVMVKGTGLRIEKILGEQLVEFFFYSIGHELGVSDYEQHGNRKFIEKYGINNIPPIHIKSELKDAKQRLKQVKKHDLCDWAIYYLKKSDIDE